MRKSIYLLLSLCSLWLMFSCGADGSRMRQQLAELEQANRDDSLMTNDSLAEVLVDYFETHGSPNERMRARYILGRTYADLGKTPQAIEAYNKASDYAEEHRRECDINILARIYGQKAVLLSRQYLPQEAAVELNKAIVCALEVEDTLSALIYKDNKLITYYQLGMYDSLLIQTDEVFRGFVGREQNQRAANSLVSSLFVLLQKHQDMEKAKQYIAFYGRYADHADRSNRKKAFYASFLGQYHLHYNQVDSAISYFRRQMAYSHQLDNRVQAYYGLFKAYQKGNQKDSASKYAEYYCLANDSSNIFRSADRIQHMQSLFRYERSEREALLNKKAAAFNRKLMWSAIIIALALIYIVIMHYRKSLSEDRNKMATLNQKYNSIRESYEQAKLDKVLYEQESASFVQQKEAEIEQYRNLLLKYENFEREDDGEIDNLSENVLLKKLHSRASAGKSISDGELEEIFSLIKRIYPNFFSEIGKMSIKLTHKQMSLCALTKLYFIPAEIGSLLNMRYQAVSNMRSRLAKTFFGDNSDTRDFDKGIHSIC